MNPEHLTNFAAAEAVREASISSTTPSPEVDDIDAHQRWLETAGRSLEGMSEGLRDYLRAWLELFPETGERSEGELIVGRVAEMGNALKHVPAGYHNDGLLALLLGVEDKAITGLLDGARKATTRPSLFGFFNLRRHARNRQLKLAFKSWALRRRCF